MPDAFISRKQSRSDDKRNPVAEGVHISTLHYRKMKNLHHFRDKRLQK